MQLVKQKKSLSQLLYHSHTTCVHIYVHSATHINSGRDVFLIREAVVGGERGGGAGLVHLSQAASLPVLLPPPRERSTAVTGKPYCPERGSHSSPPSSILHPSVPPALHLSAQTPLQEDETNQQAQPLCSQPARLQFQTSLDHFSCSPEMNNAHINWCQLINFRLTALYFSIRVWLLRFVLQNSLRRLLLQIIPAPLFSTTAFPYDKIQKSSYIFTVACKCQ